MKTLFQLAVVAALCLKAGAQGPNTVLIGQEGITVTAISSPTAVLSFGAGTTWNTITAPKLPLVVNCSTACPQLGGDPAPFVTKSLYAQQQATAYTVTLSNGTTKTVPGLSVTYKITCTRTGTIPSGSTSMTITATSCTAVKQ